MFAKVLRVAVVAPSGVFDPARLEKGMALAESWGLECVPSPNLGARHRYLAGTVEQRAADLRWAMTAPDIDAVWFARGGYGTAQLLAHLPLGELDDRPIIGFSDATALFCAMRGRGRAVHGPVLHSLADLADRESQEALRALLLEGVHPPLPGTSLNGPVSPVIAPLTGGNLMVLASLCGTPWAWSARDHIAILEDIGEAPYRLERALHQLIDAGALDGVAGVALGEFTDCNPGANATWSTSDVLLETLAPLGVPVVAGLPVGHGSRNRAWTLGAIAELYSGGLRVG